MGTDTACLLVEGFHLPTVGVHVLSWMLTGVPKRRQRTSEVNSHLSVSCWNEPAKAANPKGAYLTLSLENCLAGSCEQLRLSRDFSSLFLVGFLLFCRGGQVATCLNQLGVSALYTRYVIES